MTSFIKSLLIMTTIFNFNSSSNIKNWRIVDDVVMGGRSTSSFTLNAQGNGIFTGEVSLENNGGFCSLRYNTEAISVNSITKIVIKLRGDGKTYQFRVKEKNSDAPSYITTFQTTGKWQDIVIPLKYLTPSYRGRTLDKPNFSANSIEEIGFLIGNKKSEAFTLLLDSITLK